MNHVQEEYENSWAESNTYIVYVLSVSDLTREVNEQNNAYFPIFSYAQQSSQQDLIDREIQTHVLQMCWDNGLNVVSKSYDGASVGLTIRDNNGNPLTLFELARSIKRTPISRKTDCLRTTPKVKDEITKA